MRNQCQTILSWDSSPSKDIGTDYSIRCLLPHSYLGTVRTWQIFCVGWSVNAEKQAIFVPCEVETWRPMIGSTTAATASATGYTNNGKFGLCGHLCGSVAADKTFLRFTAGGFGACHLNEPVGGAA